MGSPGTYSLSKKKSETIRRLLSSKSVSRAIGEGVSQASGQRKGVSELSPLATSFFREVLLKDWTGFIEGNEWRSCATLLLKIVSEAKAEARQGKLESWAREQEITGTSPLVDWANRLVVQLDRKLGDRDLMAFDLATYALRQTLEALYSPEKSPFALDREALLERLGSEKVDTQSAIQTYIGSYFQQIIRYTMGGYQPTSAKGGEKRHQFMAAVEKQGIPKLAEEFWKNVQEYSTTKSGAGKAASTVLADVPGWLAEVDKSIRGEGKK